MMEYKEFPALPGGEYKARITKWEEASGTFGPQRKWTLDLGAVDDGDGNIEERQVIVYTPAQITAKNKAGKLVYAAGFELGEDIDENDLLNRTIMLLVTREPSEDGKSYVNKYPGFMRIKGAKPAVRSEPVAAGADLDTIPF